MKRSNSPYCDQISNASSYQDESSDHLEQKTKRFKVFEKDVELSEENRTNFTSISAKRNNRNISLIITSIKEDEEANLLSSEGSFYSDDEEECLKGLLNLKSALVNQKETNEVPEENSNEENDKESTFMINGAEELSEDEEDLSVHEKKWDKKYMEMKKFKKKHGHCKVPSDHSLYTWALEQRHKEMNSTLTKRRYHKLDKLSFFYKKNQKTKATPIAWKDRFDELKEFHDSNGHCNLPSNHPSYPWFNLQRQLARKSKLPKEKYKLLDSIGFPWNPDGANKSKDDIWKDHLYELLAFKEENGHMKVPPGPLGTWVYLQRKAYKLAKIKKDRLVQLESIGFQWETNKRT